MEFMDHSVSESWMRSSIELYSVISLNRNYVRYYRLLLLSAAIQKCEAGRMRVSTFSARFILLKIFASCVLTIVCYCFAGYIYIV